MTPLRPSVKPMYKIENGGIEPRSDMAAPCFPGRVLIDCLGKTMIRPSILIALIMLILAGCPGQGYALDLFDGWDNWDKGLYTAAVVSTGIDMYTTHCLIDKGGYERNHILSKHPGTGRLIAHWGVCAVGEYLIANILPSRRRKAFLSGCISLEIGYARRNYITIQCNF